MVAMRRSSWLVVQLLLAATQQRWAVVDGSDGSDGQSHGFDPVGSLFPSLPKLTVAQIKADPVCRPTDHATRPANYKNTKCEDSTSMQIRRAPACS